MSESSPHAPATATDLRGFLDQLKAARPQDLAIVEREVDAVEEAIALVRNLEARGQHPAVWFKRVRGTTAPVLVNMHASEDRLALALGTSRDRLNATYAARMQQLIAPQIVAEGPVHECHIPEHEIDLRTLPILTPFSDCPAPYISGGIMVVKDCETGIRNLSYIRLMVTGPRTMTIVSEGPYGEFTGYALPAEEQPRVYVRSISHRRDPIYQDVVPGGREHLLMGKIPKESTQEGFLRGMFPIVRRVHMPFSGRGRFHLVISVGSHRAADIRRLLVAAFVNDHFIKHAFVVDEDVNVEDDAEVLWALSTCFQGDRDMVVIERMPGSSLDPSGYPGATGAKIGFDCTRKGAGFPPRFRMNPAVLAKMKPEDFVR